MTGADTIAVVVHDTWLDGQDVKVLDVRSANGAALPAFSAGAHIDVHTPSAIRQYSLCNSDDETHRYLIAVAREPQSRGGSDYIHSQLHAGDSVNVSAPRNHFALDAQANHSVLIAGGIGVTPILAMIYQLERQQRPWTLHYSAKTPQSAPMASLLASLLADVHFGTAHIYYSAEQQRMELRCIRDNAPIGAHFYCCGPTRLLDDFDDTFQVIPENRKHSERFSADDLVAAGGGFTLKLARSGLEVEVAEDESILSVLKQHKINVTYACEEGLCGSCEVAVLEGTPDHRDGVLSDAEKASNQTIMTCCSGAKSKRLVLDI
ncbi:PDR/VanB family oxidoreductase [Halioxenophilus aromaticivorans]|uniref:PDR/VanB family oxidoreductase n=1 Tax=Halioxenophilus aromaticivorans TaxID=1306992 RepID=A0AAV3U752_9ALTE